MVVVLAGSSVSLTWEQAVKAAEDSSELKSARKELESSEWSYKTAASAFMPQLSANASMTETTSSTSPARSYAYGLSATQYLFKGMAGVYGIQSAYADVEYKRASLRSAQASVYYDLRSAFIDLLYTQENIKLLENILKQRKENSSLIQLRYESGKEDKGNLMTTQAEQAQAKYDLSSAKRDLKLAKLKISQLLSKNVRSADEKINFTAPAGTDFDKLLGEVPSYVMAEKLLESSELSFKSTISGFLPSVYLNGSLSKRGNDWPPDGDTNSWSLNLSYPFFPGGSNVTDRAAKSAQLDGAREEFIKQAKALRYSLEEAFEAFNDAIESLRVSDVSLAATGERARIIEAKYLNGLAIYDEWYRIENNYINSRKGLLNSKKQALLAEAAWHQSYGGFVK